MFERASEQADFARPDVNSYVYTECVQTIYPIDGTATPLTPGRVIEHEVPDMYGRPWAHIWEKYWEPGMQRAESDDIRFRGRQRPLKGNQIARS